MPPPPKVEFRGSELVASDYYSAESPWVEGGFCWLECHQGNLWLLCPSSGRLSFPLCHWSFASFCLLTRGPWKGEEERVELLFASDLATADTSLTLRPWQCNRLPGWQPGNRCWRLHVVAGSLDRPGEFERVFWRTVFWRSADLPCLEPWEGPRPDGLFQSSGLPQLTRDENDSWWSRIHELNGTYRNKKPKRLNEGWFETLKRRYRPEDPMVY
jgi:hypothetical protein